MRIAIVEDEQDELDCLSRRLEHQLSLLGYTENVIRCYRSAEEFLAAWRPGGCDLILLDIYMEGMPGIEAARRIRERDADCRLVFCTSSNAFASESYEVGAHYYLHKPFSDRDIMNMLRKLDLESYESTRFITLPDGKRIFPRNIIYTEYHNHVVTMHMKKDGQLRTRISQAGFQDLLLEYPYFCCCAELEQQNHMLLLENLQYVNLKDRIQETRRAEHDLRHHMALMAAYLEDGEYDRLRAYLDEYRSSLPEDSQAVFCRNHTANLLLSYFARQATDAGAGFAVYGNLPANLGIAESDLSVILGNLLENALQACMAQEGSRRQIVFRGKMEGQCLLVTVDNTFEGELRQDPNGALLLEKRGGSGLGLESVRHIAARYGGMLRTECRDGMFCASVLLKL